MTKKVDRWTPVRKGGVYCSPACGRGCTIKEYRDAQKSADNLARKLGRGWKGEVWENLGWHAEVTKGCCAIAVPKKVPGRPVSYGISYDINFGSTAKHIWIDGPNVKKALKMAVQQAIDDANTLLRDAAKLKDGL